MVPGGPLVTATALECFLSSDGVVGVEKAVKGGRLDGTHHSINQDARPTWRRQWLTMKGKGKCVARWDRELRGHGAFSSSSN